MNKVFSALILILSFGLASNPLAAQNCNVPNTITAVPQSASSAQLSWSIANPPVGASYEVEIVPLGQSFSGQPDSVGEIDRGISDKRTEMPYTPLDRERPGPARKPACRQTSGTSLDHIPQRLAGQIRIRNAASCALILSFLLADRFIGDAPPPIGQK